MGTSESTYGIPEENMLSFLPDFIFQTITQISPAFLREHGIRLLLMDFDNTMLPYTTDRPEQPLLDWIAGMQDAGITLCIVSNSHKQRVPHFSQQYHVPCVTHAASPAHAASGRPWPATEPLRSRPHSWATRSIPMCSAQSAPGSRRSPCDPFIIIPSG